MSRAKIDAFIGVFLLLLSSLIFLFSRSFPPRSQFFVNLLVFILFILTIIYLIQTFFVIRKISNQGNQEDEIEHIKEKKYKPVFVTIFGIGIYILILIPVAGFIPATVIILFSLMYLLGIRSKSFLIGITLFLPLILFLVFQIFLSIPVPTGLFY
ncbi:MAG: tripartite tricarboxylate transporter TctB family protein [Peptococcaceae bacterium]